MDGQQPVGADDKICRVIESLRVYEFSLMRKTVDVRGKEAEQLLAAWEQSSTGDPNTIMRPGVLLESVRRQRGKDFPIYDNSGVRGPENIIGSVKADEFTGEVKIYYLTRQPDVNFGYMVEKQQLCSLVEAAKVTFTEQPKEHADAFKALAEPPAAMEPTSFVPFASPTTMCGECLTCSRCAISGAPDLVGRQPWFYGYKCRNCQYVVGPLAETPSVAMQNWNNFHRRRFDFTRKSTKAQSLDQSVGEFRQRLAEFPHTSEPVTRLLYTDLRMLAYEMLSELQATFPVEEEDEKTGCAALLADLMGSHPHCSYCSEDLRPKMCGLCSSLRLDCPTAGCEGQDDPQDMEEGG